MPDVRALQLPKREHVIASMIRDGVTSNEVMAAASGQTKNEVFTIISMLKKKCGGVKSRDDLRERLLSVELVMLDKRTLMKNGSRRVSGLEEEEVDERDADLTAWAGECEWPDYGAHNLPMK